MFHAFWAGEIYIFYYLNCIKSFIFRYFPLVCLYLLLILSKEPLFLGSWLRLWRKLLSRLLCQRPITLWETIHYFHTAVIYLEKDYTFSSILTILPKPSRLSLNFTLHLHRKCVSVSLVTVLLLVPLTLRWSHRGNLRSPLCPFSPPSPLSHGR